MNQSMINFRYYLRGLFYLRIIIFLIFRLILKILILKNIIHHKTPKYFHFFFVKQARSPNFILTKIKNHSKYPQKNFEII